MGYNARIEQLERDANDGGPILELVNIRVAYSQNGGVYKAYYISSGDEVTFSELKNMYDNGKIIYLFEADDSEEHQILPFGVMTYCNAQLSCGGMTVIDDLLHVVNIDIGENLISIDILW